MTENCTCASGISRVGVNLEVLYFPDDINSCGRSFQLDWSSCPSCGPSTWSGSSTMHSGSQCSTNSRKLRNVSRRGEISHNQFNVPLSLPDVIFSAIGALIWSIIIGTWVVVFQTNRTEWGEFADSISFVIPLGRA